MSALAALILAAGLILAAALLCVPLHRLTEVLAELEIRSAGTFPPADPEVVGDGSR